VTDNFAVAAVKRDLAALYFRDHAKPVIFILEDPPGIIEGAIGERGEHGLEKFRQGRYPPQAQASFRERCGR
jgi:hypothetical protein